MSDVIPVIYSKNELELIRFCQISYSKSSIFDWVNTLITTNRRNKPTNFCYRIIVEGTVNRIIVESTVNEDSKMMLCS